MEHFDASWNDEMAILPVGGELSVVAATNASGIDAQRQNLTPTAVSSRKSFTPKDRNHKMHSSRDKPLLLIHIGYAIRSTLPSFLL